MRKRERGGNMPQDMRLPPAINILHAMCVTAVRAVAGALPLDLLVYIVCCLCVYQLIKPAMYSSTNQCHIRLSLYLVFIRLIMIMCCHGHLAGKK